MAVEPIAGKTILTDDHGCTNHNGIGYAQIAIASQTVTIEDGTAYDGLQQVVGEAHAVKDAKVMQHLANFVESIPG